MKFRLLNSNTGTRQKQVDFQTVTAWKFYRYVGKQKSESSDVYALK